MHILRSLVPEFRLFIAGIGITFMGYVSLIVCMADFVSSMPFSGGFVVSIVAIRNLLNGFLNHLLRRKLWFYSSLYWIVCWFCFWMRRNHSKYPLCNCEMFHFDDKFINLNQWIFFVDKF
jgi:hypothetical protein